jgi:hypothetical protein
MQPGNIVWILNTAGEYYILTELFKMLGEFLRGRTVD